MKLKECGRQRICGMNLAFRFLIGSLEKVLWHHVSRQTVGHCDEAKEWNGVSF
jgi:hypothetical protein